MNSKTDTIGSFRIPGVLSMDSWQRDVVGA